MLYRCTIFFRDAVDRTSRARQASQAFTFLGSLNSFGMSVVTPIADKLLQCRDCPLCAISDRCIAANRISIQSPHRRRPAGPVGWSVGKGFFSALVLWTDFFQSTIVAMR